MAQTCSCCLVSSDPGSIRCVSSIPVVRDRDGHSTGRGQRRGMALPLPSCLATWSLRGTESLGCEKSSWPGRGGSPLLPALALAHTQASVFPHRPEGTANAGPGPRLCLQTETWAGCALRHANLHMTGHVNMNTGAQTHRQTQTDRP